MADESSAGFDALLTEDRSFPPPEEFAKNANMNDPDIYAKADADPEAFWAGIASELEWSRPWDTILDWQPPDAKWFVGGKINASVNCVDRHALGSRRDKRAIVWEGEPGDQKTLTYGELHVEVQKCANVLKQLGVGHGDRVAVYLPMVPELPIVMLACARIGAVHSVVFGGFSAESLRDRMNDMQAKLLVTADGGFRRGSVVPLKEISDVALDGASSVEAVLLVKREGLETPFQVVEGRDHWYHELMAQVPETCEARENDAEDLLFTLYTSGTTGKPKGIAHTTGGYLTGTYITAKWVFDLKEDDVYWCSADIGWVTGHSYLVYGPLANGATCVMYEGAPDAPGRDRFWDMIERHKVTIFYTAPTAIRAFMKWGPDHVSKHDLSTLRLIGSVGEPINPEAWMWYHEHVGGGRCPIVDTWWQTETGCILITPLPGLTTLKPGSATRPFPGLRPAVVTEGGDEVKVGGGYLVQTRPWPSMLRTIYGDHDRYVTTYWNRWGHSTYVTGDGAKVDEDGYFWLLGRVDDVLNVAGHRVGTMEVESALVDHQEVAEAAVVGKAHEIKGQGICAFVTLKDGVTGSDEKVQELRQHVATKIGAIAKPDEILWTADLPKTRSGKIMRRLLRDIAAGKALGDVTTLADPSIVAKLREQYEEKEG